MRLSLLLTSLFLPQALSQAAGAAAQKEQSDPYSTQSTARRERNLDHLDVATLTYYLGIDSSTLKSLENAPKVGHDVAVMFYAQWDQNSHTLAPYWDRIATMVKAGQKDSKVIMGLFNCELDTEHSQLCTAVGVQHYPTLLFIGAPPFHDKVLGSKSAAPLPNTVKFQGNWQYTDSILDWIRAMQALSTWNKVSFLKSLRRGLLGFLKKPQPHDHGSLPVGLPIATAAMSDAGIPSAQVSLMEKQFQVIQEESKKMEKLATHASLLLNSVMLPPSEQDAFSMLKQDNGWDATNQDAVSQVLRNCVAELSLDYCSRVSTKITTDFVNNMDSTKDYGNFTEIEAKLKGQIEEMEPYCAIFDECLASDFVAEKCRPDKCPFNDQVACRYLSSCFDETIQEEYAVALGLIKESDTFPPKQQSAAAAAAATGDGDTKAQSDSKGGRWGMFS